MKIKLDENLPVRLATVLRDLRHDVETPVDEDLVGSDDARLWQRVQAEGRFFITQDHDFADSRRFPAGSHHGLLLVRMGHVGRGALFERLTAVFREEPLESWARCIVVVGVHRIRVRQPPNE